MPDFRRSAAFYQALLGWTMRLGNGTQASVLESFHVPDAMGWDLQIGNKISPR